jgi:hypothetical protein
MYEANIGDTGIFGGKLRGIVRALAIWSPFENVLVFFYDKDTHYTKHQFVSSRIVLTEKNIDFRISTYYLKSRTIDFIEYPEFVSDEEEPKFITDDGQQDE